MKKLYIPESVKTRSEIFNGFGFPQLTTTVIITAVAGTISFTFYLFHHNLPTLVTSILISCAASVSILTKDATNQSVADYVKNLLRYVKSQKKYLYYNGKEW